MSEEETKPNDSFDFDSLSLAKEYAEKYGWSSFPLFGIKRQDNNDGSYILRCTCGKAECGKNSGKHPSCFRGFKDASSNPVVLHNLWKGRKGLNYGIATGAVSGVVVIDIDGDEGEESLKKLEEKLGKLPRTFTVSSARGRHLYFKYPDRQVFSTSNDLGIKIDVRGDNGYIVGPGSKHYLGIDYEIIDDTEFAELKPRWVDRMASKNRKAPVVNPNFADDPDKQEWSKSDVQDMLDVLDAGMPRNEWLNVGMALQSGGYPFEMWNEWSKGSDKYSAADIIKDWRSFKTDGGITMGTLVEMATLNGWKPASYFVEDTEGGWDNHPARDWYFGLVGANDEVPEIQNNTMFGDAKKGLPYHLDPRDLDASLIGDTVRWICSSSYRQQPELALLNTLAALGAVFGRRYRSTTGLRTNVYMCGIAGTAAGKDSSRKRLANLMEEAGLGEFNASEKIISATGLERQIEDKPSCVMMIDEFGLALGYMSSENAPAYLSQISSLILTLFTSSDKAVLNCGKYAGKDVEEISLHYPCLSIFGTTTLETYLGALKKLDVMSGNMNRYIILPGRLRPEKRYGDLSTDIPDSLLKQWKELVPAGGIGEMNSNLITPDPYEVGYADEEAKKYAGWTLVDIEESKMYPSGVQDTSQTTAIYGRYRELIIKLAMIWAIADNVHRPRITLANLKNGKRIVDASLSYMMELVDDYMYENEVAKRKNAVYRTIKAAGSEGIKRKDLSRKYRELRAKEMDDVITSLQLEEVVEIIKSPTKTKAAIAYRAV